MKNKFSYFALVGLLVSTGPKLLADDFNEAIIRGKQLIEKGASKLDEKLLMSARSHFERLLQNQEFAWLTRYYVAYADYRLAIYHQLQNNKEAQVKFLNEGIEMAQACLQKKEKFADAHALLSALLGHKIGTDPSLGMTLGMQTYASMSEALTYGEANPRVALFSAISAYYTPEQFGGSKTKAADEIARAVDLFADESVVDKRLPDWGHSEALTWQAKFYLESDQVDLAEQSLRAALELDSQNGFALSLQRDLQTRLAGAEK